MQKKLLYFQHSFPAELMIQVQCVCCNTLQINKQQDGIDCFSWYYSLHEMLASVETEFQHNSCSTFLEKIVITKY